MARQVTLKQLTRCAEQLREAYAPLKDAVKHTEWANDFLYPDFGIAPIRDMRDTLRKQLGILEVEISWIEGEIAKRQKET